MLKIKVQMSTKKPQISQSGSTKKSEVFSWMGFFKFKIASIINSVMELEQCSGYDAKAGEMDLLEIKGNK